MQRERRRAREEKKRRNEGKEEKSRGMIGRGKEKRKGRAKEGVE